MTLKEIEAAERSAYLTWEDKAEDVTLLRNQLADAEEQMLKARIRWDKTRIALDNARTLARMAADLADLPTQKPQ